MLDPYSLGDHSIELRVHWGVSFCQCPVAVDWSFGAPEMFCVTQSYKDPRRDVQGPLSDRLPGQHPGRVAVASLGDVRPGVQVALLALEGRLAAVQRESVVEPV